MSTQSFMNTRDVYLELTIFAKRLQFERLKIIDIQLQYMYK